MSEQSTIPAGETTHRMWPRLVVPLALLLVLAAGLSFAIFKPQAKPTLPGGAQQSAPGGGYFITLALPARQAPPIDLRSYTGQPVTLSEYHGQAARRAEPARRAVRPDADHRGLRGPARGHAGGGRPLHQGTRDAGADAVPDRLGGRTRAHVGGVERRLDARSRPARPDRPLGARL